MGWLQRRFGGSGKVRPSRWTPTRAATTAQGRDMPWIPPTPLRQRVHCWGPTPISIEVEGEYFRGNAFRALFADEPAFRTVDGHELKGSAALVPDPDNPYDSKAVAVYLEDQHVGYLPREMAAVWHRPLTTPGGEVATLLTPARAWARLDGDQVRARVTVRLPEHPDHIPPTTGYPKGRLAPLPPGNRAQVTKEEGHQEHLRALLRMHGPSATYAAVLRSADRPGPRDTTETIVEVLINDELVGELTTITSPRYLPAIEHAAQSGDLVVARASLTEGERKVEVGLDALKDAHLLAGLPADEPETLSPPPSLVPAGWYPLDGVQRYWDGSTWTEHTAPLVGWYQLDGVFRYWDGSSWIEHTAPR